MAPNDPTHETKKDRTDPADPDLLAHIRSLGLVAVENYIAWCVRHGFSRRSDKHWRVRLKELEEWYRTLDRLSAAKERPGKATGRQIRGADATYVANPQTWASKRCQVITPE